MEIESDHLRIEGAAGEWARVDTDTGENYYVREVKVAGLELSADTSGAFTIQYTDYSIDDTQPYWPVLLIEAAKWYNPPEEE
jgi:hypothetical protein